MTEQSFKVKFDGLHGVLQIEVIQDLRVEHAHRANLLVAQNYCEAACRQIAWVVTALFKAVVFSESGTDF